MELSEKAKEMRNKYAREYRQKHPEKLRLYNIRYWEKKATSYTPELQARELHNKGYTQRAIAEELSISLGTVNKYLNKNEQKK